MNTDTLKRWLPRIAVIGLALALISVAVTTPIVQRAHTDSGETRPGVAAALAQVQAVHPASLTDAGFLAALDQARQAPYVVGVWLFTREGEILQSYNPGTDTGTVSEWATAETQRVLETLPEDSLTPDQRTQVLAAAVMQREGEHNDIFRQMLGPVEDPDGALLGWVGFTYDVSSTTGEPGALWIAMLLVGLGGLGLYWLSLPVWVWLDARQHGERAWVWATFVLIGNLVALIAYILARAPRPQPR